jgi:hypothetical protein
MHKLPGLHVCLHRIARRALAAQPRGYQQQQHQLAHILP